MSENIQPENVVENALIEQFVRHGNDDAFSKLYELSKARLQRYAYRFLQDENKAQDIVHETFLRLHQQREQRRKALADGQTTTVAWLFMIARNSAIDELRKTVLHKEDSYESLIDAGNDPEMQGTSKTENPDAHPYDYSHLGAQRSPSVDEILKVIGETGEMTDDEIENLRKLIQPHLWKKDKFDYQMFAQEEGISEATARKRISRLQIKRIPEIIRRVGGPAAFWALARRAAAWMRSLANQRSFVYSSAGLAAILILLLLWFLLNDRKGSTSTSPSITAELQGQPPSKANLAISQPRLVDGTQAGRTQRIEYTAEAILPSNIPRGIISVEVVVLYREDTMTSARKEKFSQALGRSVKSHSFSPVQPQAAFAENAVIKGTIDYNAGAGNDMNECAEFVKKILDEAESGLGDKFWILGFGGGSATGADPFAPVQAPRVVKVTLPDVYIPAR